MEGMDVDLDPELMQKFSCLGTTDKDVLISEFQRLLGFQLNPAGCAFFLDMTNWNLQAAIGAYYDFESPNISVPSMSFVEDVTIGEGESIPPDTQFIKTWRIQNSDVIWVILSVEVGGLLGVTQQLSSFETEFNTQPHRKVEGNFNPFASPQKNRQSDENNLKDPGGSEFDSISKNTWAPAPDQTEQDENRLSQNSVNLSPSSHANNLSVVTYSKAKWTCQHNGTSVSARNGTSLEPSPAVHEYHQFSGPSALCPEKALDWKACSSHIIQPTRPDTTLGENHQREPGLRGPYPFGQS
ncbi:protein ILRUN isoform X2 [Talpa occidentalis]|uniref:protein ILRUN isoform X2 n=1 Tax=Talpa occidentalis TaxID=50954 RepID=UPI0023F67F17|nr:protein ILRUN isoform X2 [Talpa occidentalis]